MLGLIVRASVRVRLVLSAVLSSVVSSGLVMSAILSSSVSPEVIGVTAEVAANRRWWDLTEGSLKGVFGRLQRQSLGRCERADAGVVSMDEFSAVRKLIGEIPKVMAGAVVTEADLISEEGTSVRVTGQHTTHNRANVVFVAVKRALTIVGHDRVRFEHVDVDHFVQPLVVQVAQAIVVVAQNRFDAERRIVIRVRPLALALARQTLEKDRIVYF